MLKRIHVDNFRCLVNFDLSLDRFNLLLGENGGGKSAVFDVLRLLHGFLNGTANVDVFAFNDLTRWQQTGVQQFEMEVVIEKDHFLYALSIEHDREKKRRRIKRESLKVNGKPLFDFKVENREGMAQLYRDDFSTGPQYPFDWSRSGVASLPERHDNKKLWGFRREISKYIIVGFCPVCMSSEGEEEESHLAARGENFASWLRYLTQEHQGHIFDLTKELRKALQGFDSFSLREAGEKARVLNVLFEHGVKGSKPIPYTFRELSDGQRQLIALYTVLYGIGGEGYSLFLDEPDNYVALREIQPWLASLHDACGQGVSQAVLISHHPEIIDYFSGSSGRWFERTDNGPTRVLEKMPAPTEGLTASETIARGWNR